MPHFELVYSILWPIVCTDLIPIRHVYLWAQRVHFSWLSLSLHFHFPLAHVLSLLSMYVFRSMCGSKGWCVKITWNHKTCSIYFPCEVLKANVFLKTLEFFQDYPNLFWRFLIKINCLCIFNCSFFPFLIFQVRQCLHLHIRTHGIISRYFKPVDSRNSKRNSIRSTQMTPRILFNRFILDQTLGCGYAA